MTVSRWHLFRGLFNVPSAAGFDAPPDRPEEKPNWSKRYPNDKRERARRSERDF